MLLGCVSKGAPDPSLSETASEADTDADSDADADTDSDSDSDPPLPPGCGDLVCADGEACGVCPIDCGPCPSSCDEDGICEVASGESCPACKSDCDTPLPVCGNGHCQPGESPQGCMADCGPQSWPAAWAQQEELLLLAINLERAAGTDCGSVPFSPAAPLQFEAALMIPARLHSWDQSLTGYFGAESCDGRQLQDRAGTAQFEVLGWGWPTAQSVVAAWMSGPECEALMEPGYTRAGAGYSDVGGDPLWTFLLR